MLTFLFSRERRARAYCTRLAQCFCCSCPAAERSQAKMKTTGLAVCLVFVLAASATCTESPPRQLNTVRRKATNVSNICEPDDVDVSMALAYSSSSY